MNRKIPTLKNLNGNLLATVDVETTGRVGGYHEIIQIAIVPLTIDLEIAPVEPFYQVLRPEHPDRVSRGARRVHGLNVDDLIMNAPSQGRVIQYLIEWFNSLNLGYERRIVPIAHNWAFERGFLIHWLGAELLDTLFVPLPRDTMIFATMLNDRASMMGVDPPFPRVSLSSLCYQLGIEHENAHDALEDCIVTAKLYQYLMRACI